jgi:hypothetical protein
MQKNDIFNLNSAYNQVITEGAADLGPQADSQQGLSPVIPTIIKQKKKDEQCEGNGSTCMCDKCNKARDEECESCGCNGNPEMSEVTPHSQSNESDDIQMAKNEIYNTVFHATEIYNKLKTAKNLEGWVQSKITKAADYLNSVKHYLDYENLHSEENEEGDIESSLNSGSDHLLSRLTAILSRESKENLHKVLYEVVKLIEDKN